jgi:hypothetical protein
VGLIGERGSGIGETISMKWKAASALTAAVVAATIAAAGAPAIQLRAGDILIEAHGDFSPRALPRDHNAPITLRGGGRISTVSGALPPTLETIAIEFDRHGSVDTTGLPTCSMGRLIATTTRTARKLCPGAIVGGGFGKALVKLPEQAAFPVSSPITLFNAPRRNGNPTLLAHAHLTQPVPTTFVVPIVIERIHKGIYGYRTKTTIPRIADGAGIPIAGSLRIGRKWSYRGRRYSYVNARCETGRLQARGEFTFDDGTELSGTFIRPCAVR